MAETEPAEGIDAKAGAALGMCVCCVDVGKERTEKTGAMGKALIASLLVL